MVKDIIENNENIKGNEHALNLLRRDFPQCFTKDGIFDLDVFKSIVGKTVPTVNEGYSLQFLGKSYASLIASTDTTTVIKPDLEHNAKPENLNSKNIYISGDNIDALKHLRNSYSQAVKFIYIDPPYNTGSDGFVYNDNFNYTAEQLQQRLGISDAAANRILEMTTRGSASHSAWLAFMFPRLLLAHDLLSKDGVIFISIDDNEQANLKILCDSIFGEENFVAQICWKARGGRQDSKHFAVMHEYILCYSPDKDLFIAGEEEKGEDVYPKYDAEKKRYYKTQLLRKWGSNSLRSDRPNLYYPIPGPNGKEIYPLIYSESGDNSAQKSPIFGRWRWGASTMNKAREEGRIEFQKDKYGNWIAYEKIFEPSEGEKPTKKYITWLEDTNNGAATVKELFGFSVFDYPKSTDIVSKLLKMANVEDGDIALDFFSGSATTAQSVMELDQEINFILVQWPEETKEGSEARKAGYRTIDEIGQERIRRAAKKIKEENPLFAGDLGFKHYTLAEPSDQTFAKLEEFNPDTLFADSILDEFGVDTVLSTWTVRDGYGFNAEITPIDLNGYKAYLCGRHLYFINPGFGLDEEATPLVALIDKYNTEKDFKPENIVLFGYSFNYSETEALKKNLIPLRYGIKNLKVNLDVRY
ncbi:MAG: site-specific DNA-methyltransferase [Lachnospiraceae bacterium]|nr:site-specific DNA-methyltransferase [Lachnospiraceae bacterium]